MSVSLVRFKNVDFINYNKEFTCDIEVYYNEEIFLFQATFQVYWMFRVVKLRNVTPSIYGFLNITSRQLEIQALQKLKELNLLRVSKNI